MKAELRIMRAKALATYIFSHKYLYHAEGMTNNFHADGFDTAYYFDPMSDNGDVVYDIAESLLYADEDEVLTPKGRRDLDEILASYYEMMDCLFEMLRSEGKLVSYQSGCRNPNIFDSSMGNLTDEYLEHSEIVRLEVVKCLADF